MKNKLVFTLLCLCSLQLVIAQNREPKKQDPEAFDEDAAMLTAKAKGIKASELKGYISYLKNDFSSKKALTQQKHLHTPYETVAGGDVQETVIYLSPNKAMSIGCPNMSFDQYNFTGWTGGTGTVTTGASGGNPIYTATSTAIINTAGNNISVLNTTNFHTIMSTPASNKVYPNCSSFGYDSLACRAVGSQTLSEIPFVSPFSFDPVSVRMNSSNANYRACRLKYITTSSSTNQRLSFSYAVVLQNPASHLVNESPYFKISVRNEATGAILPGCTSYTFNPKSVVPADSIKTSVVGSTVDPTFYRKWQYYSVDLSSLPAGTNVSINFEVGGCTQSGHWGYAYVDAECGGLGTPYANMCSGSTFATLVAPTGFSTYQWTGPSGVIPSGSGGTNDTLTVNPATAGDTYTVSMISPGGCSITQTVSITLTTVSIINLNSTSSCNGGNSGTAYVQAIGSNGVYTYTWTSTSTGSVVSNAQTATGLAPGNYSIVVASTSCGQVSANLSVGISPALYFSQPKTFCGNSTSIAVPGGTGYQWYQGQTNTLIAAPNGTNDTLQIANAVSGNIYTLVYTTPSGCQDSIKYTLSQVSGGSTYVNSIQNVCPGSSNGSVVLNLSTPFSAPYTYSVTGPTAGTLVANTTTTATSLSLSPLAAGTYSYLVTDSMCMYHSTFDISPIQTNFTITPTNLVLCFPIDTARLSLNFGPGMPANCGVDPILCSGVSPTILFASGTFTQNSSFTYPTPYGNEYTYAKHQYLIRKAELNAAGVYGGRISSLAFNVLNLNTSTLNYPNFEIKMGCTSLSALPNASLSPSPFVSGLQTVYTNPNQSITTGWVTHNFTQSYLWDGVSNVIIETCFGQNAANTWTANASVQLKQMSYTASMFYREDNNPVCGGSQLANNASSMANGANMLPNMQFGHCAASAQASSYTVSISSNGTIVQNYGNDSIKVVPTFTVPPLSNTPVIYTISVTNPNGGCVKTQTVSVIYPSSVIGITTVPTTTTICEGSQISLSAGGAFLYMWYYQQGASSVSIATTPSVVVTPPSVGVNLYSVTGSSSCPGTIPDTKTITINVTPKANLVVSPLQDITKCMNKNYVITTGVNSTTPGNPGAPYSYAWTTLPTNAPASGINNTSSYSVTANSTTTLVFTVNGICANAANDTVVVKNFVDNLSIAIINSSTICANSPFTLRSSATNGYLKYNYGWFISPSNNAISNSANLSYVSPNAEGTYTITLYVNDSCEYSRAAYEVITVLPPCNVIIPNVITPNGDGVNDFFKIVNIEHHPNTTLTIFDRWGKKVFESSNYSNEWGADHLADGTFFYVIDVPDDKKYSGFITVFHDK